MTEAWFKALGDLSKVAGGPALPSFVGAVRREGRESFLRLGFPTTEEEAWRYTSVEPIVRTEFHLAMPVRPEGFGDLRTLPSGAVVGSLAAALKERPELVERNLNRQADIRNHPFTALNSAFLADGAFVWLPRGVRLTEPIVIRYTAPANGRSAFIPARNLILLEEGSGGAVVETYSGPSGSVYLANPVTEIVLGDGAAVEHYKIQEEGEEAFHLGEVAVSQGRESRFTSHIVSLGGRLARSELATLFGAPGGECTLNGLYLGGGHQHIDHQTAIDHASRACTSVELYKGILDDQASAVFNGRIVVRPDAQKTVARQTNKNLLLSKEAVVNTKPLLEILANDVKCNHGATIGRLDENQLFYLRSRGLGAVEARGLLTYAFASELVEKMAVDSVKRELRDRLFARLTGRRLTSEGMA